MRNSAKMALFVLLAVIGLSGCGGGQNLAYAPAAYGENSQCYYDQDINEAYALQRAGLCGQSGSYWVPTVMPLFWHQRYYSYYSSPAYYNSYVPVSVRHVYVVHETSFQRSYSGQIKTASSQAKYKGSDGKTYTGNKVKPGSFSNGTKGFGSGKKSCSLGPVTGAGLLLSGSGGGSRPGGGSRSGSSGGSRFGGGSKGSGSGSKGSGGSHSSSTSGGSRPKSGC